MKKYTISESHRFAYEQLASISRFEDDWDGEGSLAFKKEMLEEAELLLKEVLNSDEKSPDIYAHCNEIFFEWQKGQLIERIILEDTGKNLVCSKWTSIPDKPSTYTILFVKEFKHGS